MGQRVDVDLLRRAVIVDILEDRVEFVDRVDAIGLPAALGPAGAADRRHQRIVRVGVDLDQEEFQLRRHDRLPALGGIELQHALQHEARRDVDGGAVGIDAVADHLGGRLLVPGHQADGRAVRDHVDVAVLGAGHVLVVRKIAGHGLDEDRLWHPEAPIAQDAQELLGRQDLAAGDARQIRHQALHFGDPMILDEGLQETHAVSAAEPGRRRSSAVAIVVPYYAPMAAGRQPGTRRICCIAGERV